MRISFYRDNVCGIELLASLYGSGSFKDSRDISMNAKMTDIDDDDQSDNISSHCCYSSWGNGND